jgi:hypothetical protein
MFKYSKWAIASLVIWVYHVNICSNYYPPAIDLARAICMDGIMSTEVPGLSLLFHHSLTIIYREEYLRVNDEMIRMEGA